MDLVGLQFTDKRERRSWSLGVFVSTIQSSLYLFVWQKFKQACLFVTTQRTFCSRDFWGANWRRQIVVWSYSSPFSSVITDPFANRHKSYLRASFRADLSARPKSGTLVFVLMTSYESVGFSVLQHGPGSRMCTTQRLYRCSGHFLL